MAPGSAGDLVEVGGGSAVAGVFDHRTQGFGHHCAGFCHCLDPGPGLQLNHVDDLLANKRMGMDI
jgi:hypothetical protein